MAETQEAAVKRARAAADKKAADKAAADKKAANAAAKADKAAADKKAKEADKKDTFGTEIFFVEVKEFYEALEKKVSVKENVGDFLFGEAKRNPGSTPIRLLKDGGEANGSRGRGKIKFKKGDFMLRDVDGNRLKVSSEVFRAVYKKVIG